MTLKVMIAGAGLGGLTLANGLARAGIDVTVHEREATPDSRAQGARFHMDDRGIRALHECLAPEGFALFSATVGEPSENVCVLGEADGSLAIMGRQPFTGGDGRPGQVRPGRPVSRGLLRRILLAGVVDRVRFGSELVRYERFDGGVRAHFADGTAEGDVLVGADGVGSAVRHQYLSHLDVVDTGVRWLGGKTPLTDEILATGLPELIRGSFTITSIGELGMIVAIMRFTEPPTKAAARLMPGLAVDDAEDYVMWALMPGPEQLGGSGTEIGTRAGSALWRLATSLATNANPALRLIIERAWPEQTYCLMLGAAVWDGTVWPASRVTLLGDAIHAMPPNRGSGANTALQDARRLTAALADVHNGHQELLPAIAEYERRMRNDGFEAVKASVDSLGDFLRHD